MRPSAAVVIVALALMGAGQAAAQTAGATPASGSPTADRLLMERFVRPETGGSGTGFTLQFSRDPEQSILYLVDGTNQRIWLLRRQDLNILDRFGRPGRQYGQFIRAHMLAIDSKNRIYTGEAGNGRRIQRWILTGTRPASSVEPPGL